MVDRLSIHAGETQVQTHVRGMPCTAVAIHVHIHPADPKTDASDWDYYGYDEVEFALYDRKGYRARWLEKLMTDDEAGLIRQELIEAWRRESAEFWSIA
jgi:hypothetical protein